MVSWLIEKLCVSSRVKARILDENMLRVAGDVYLKYHLIVDKV